MEITSDPAFNVYGVSNRQDRFARCNCTMNFTGKTVKEYSSAHCAINDRGCDANIIYLIIVYCLFAFLAVKDGAYR